MNDDYGIEGIANATTERTSWLQYFNPRSYARSYAIFIIVCIIIVVIMFIIYRR